VFDYSNADGWVWDVASGVATPWDGTSAAPRMPTVSAVTLSDWRGEFASTAAEETGYLDAVTNWAARGLPTASLPKPIQSSWNDFLKAKSLERLTEWFDQHGIPFPADSMERTADGDRHREQAGSEVRRYLRACIDAMTDEEIRAVTIPVEVALRVGR
jgi:hypothetical protein